MTPNLKFVIFMLALFCVLSKAHADVSCELKFDGLEELRVSSFESAVDANSLKECNAVAENFLAEAGQPPGRCAGAKAVIKGWEDSYHSDTHKTLPSDPKLAYNNLKDWAYQTLKTKCAKKQF